ncbi:MAG: ChaN family lipoprotein [Pseudomonadota bacterium]
MKIRTACFAGVLLAWCAVAQGSEQFDLPVPESAAQGVPPRVYDLTEPGKGDELAEALLDRRAVFIGEIHDRLDHHRNQLRLIEALYRRHPDLAIGVEYFQQPFQRHLDDYLAGRISEKQMLVRTEYYKRWNLDYRMLRPIVEFARAKHLPLLALNISDELHNKVFREGMGSLTTQERQQLPADIPPASASYRARLQAIFDTHPQGDNFQYFVEGQLLWDESMAERAARHLQEHPGTHIVVLAGSGHMLYGDGIPRRLNRRLGAEDGAVLLNGDEFGDYGGIADYLLVAHGRESLPEQGRLGITMDGDERGVYIRQFPAGSAAQDAGMETGDYLMALDRTPVATSADVRSMMFDKQPGESVHVRVRREHLFGADEELEFEVRLR